MNLAKALKEAEAEDAIWRETHHDEEMEEFEEAFINNDLLGSKRRHPTFVSGT